VDAVTVLTVYNGNDLKYSATAKFSEYFTESYCTVMRREIVIFNYKKEERAEWLTGDG